MKNTEIERKWLLKGFPSIPADKISFMEQGYLSLNNPNVRIRKVSGQDGEQYWITIKGRGTLVRPEVEVEIDESRYTALCSMLELPPVLKEHRTYVLQDGLVLECNLVDKGEAESFYYAEVEFGSVQQAKDFITPSFLGLEVTNDPNWTMAAYYKRKLSKLKNN